MNKVIWYSDEAYSTDTPTLLGRRAAGESFLRAYLTHSQDAAFNIYVRDKAMQEGFKQRVAQWGEGKPYTVISKSNSHKMLDCDLLFYPMPGIGQHAVRRSFFGHSAYSICGITHTTCSHSVMDAVAALATTPVQPWDALICTSACVKTSVMEVLNAQADFLKKRLGAKKFVLPQLPVIPLGIHTEDFAYTDAQKQAARQALGVDADTVVVLYMGRLSFHGKVHPFPMYKALELAAQRTGKKVVLVECGWHANRHVQKAFDEAHAAVCPSVRVVTLDGRKAEERLTAWAGADIFCSLSDNIQETYGLAPVEAMAAGLPVVASDWDGYRDTVRHEQDGFMVRTLAPEAGPAADFAQQYAWEALSYDRYIGYASLVTAIDVEDTTRAFVALLENKELRTRMGEQGRLRARQCFDWKPVIGQYEALWQQLQELRRPAGKPVPAAWASRMDPFRTFGSYPTSKMQPSTLLVLADITPLEALERSAACRSMGIFNFSGNMLPEQADLRPLLERCAGKPQRVRDLVRGLPEQEKARALRGLLWLCKLGILRWQEGNTSEVRTKN